MQQLCKILFEGDGLQQDEMSMWEHAMFYLLSKRYGLLPFQPTDMSSVQRRDAIVGKGSSRSTGKNSSTDPQE